MSQAGVQRTCDAVYELAEQITFDRRATFTHRSVSFNSQRSKAKPGISARSQGRRHLVFWSMMPAHEATSSVGPVMTGSHGRGFQTVLD
jgi:hypothetical protein